MEIAKKKSLFGKEVDMLNGSIIKGLIQITIPIMVMNVLMSIFNIVDMTILKMFDAQGDGYAVGAVGACGTLTSLITGLLIGCSSGANVCIAKRIGRGDKEGVERAVGTAMLFSVLGGLALSVIGVLGAELFLDWMNCPTELFDRAVLYFRMYFAGVPILMIYNFAAAILRSTGDTTRPMIFLTLGGVVKVLLNVLFVGVRGMSVAGVGLATICSWIFMSTLCLWTLIKRGGSVALRFNRIRFYREELIDILKIGIPAGLQQALYSVANVIITSTVMSFGTDATTGISIANNFDGILYQICHATSLAVMPYVSQNVGCGNLGRAKRSIFQGILVTFAIGAFFGSLSAIFSAQLSSIMSDIPAVIAYSQQKMIIISSTYFICGINDIWGAAMRGLGKPIIPTVTTLIYMCAFRFFWVYVVFPLTAQSMTVLYLVWPIGWILSIITLLPFYFFRIKKLSRTLDGKMAEYEKAH